MTLPRVYALHEYWKKRPPAHEVTYFAWFKDEDAEKQGFNESDVSGFAALQGVSPGWVGGPPLRPEDVMKLAEEARGRQPK